MSVDQAFLSTRPAPRSAAAKLPVSVFIIARNEADRIARAILGVRDWADEVIVIDSGSTDETVAVSQSLGARTVFHEWHGYGPQKRFGEGLCRHDWLLNIDADEEVTPAASEEIKALFRDGEPPLKAYAVRIALMFRFERQPRRFAVSTTCVRFYDRRYARFKDSAVHDSVVPLSPMPIGKLTQPFRHRSMRSHRHMVDKINSYTSMQAADMSAKGRRFGAVSIALIPVWSFFKAYILRGYIFYGVDGVTQSYLYAFAKLLRAAKTRERRDEARHEDET